MAKSDVARAVVSGATISFGLMSLPVDLVSARVSKDSKGSDVVKPSNVCPNCDTPTTLKQEYHCLNGHGPFTLAEAHKALPDAEGNLVKIDAEEVAEAKAPDIDARTILLRLFPAEQVEAATLPSGNLFRLRPTRAAKGGAQANNAAMQTYGLLRDLVTQSDAAFLAEIVVKGVAKMYRLIVHDDVLTLTELVRPEELADTGRLGLPPLPVSDPALLDAGERLVEALTEDFDPFEWTDRAQRRLRELRAKTTEGGATEETSPIVTDTAAALMELLKRSAA